MYGPWLRKGFDVRPTIAVTKAHIDLPEVREAVRVGRLVPDGKVLSKEGQSFITKVLFWTVCTRTYYMYVCDVFVVFRMDWIEF